MEDRQNKHKATSWDQSWRSKAKRKERGQRGKKKRLSFQPLVYEISCYTSDVTHGIWKDKKSNQPSTYYMYDNRRSYE